MGCTTIEQSETIWIDVNGYPPPNNIIVQPETIWIDVNGYTLPNNTD